jgi:FkbM family methyltransferase
MKPVPSRIQEAWSRCADQVTFLINGARFGFLFLRARWFRMPQKLRVAGKYISLSYPAEAGVQNDFFACFIRNEYGLRQELPEVHTILDVGANIGFFSIAARGRYPQAKIHAYEPNPRVMHHLRSNTSALGIEVHAEALGARDGFTEILDSSDSNQARALMCEGGRIPQISLENAIERIGGSVDLLKLDCEGAEWDLFRVSEIWKRVRNIRMEFHLFNGETVQQLERVLEDLGFEVVLLQPGPGFGMLWARASQVNR